MVIKMKRVEDGDTVKIYYKGTFRDGGVFGSNYDGDPLEFTVGEEEVMKGFEQAVLGMRPGETKTVEVVTDRGVGLLRKEVIRDIEPDQTYEHEKDEIDQDVPSMVDDGETTGVNINNPQADKDNDDDLSLAGKELIFEIELVDIK